MKYIPIIVVLVTSLVIGSLIIAKNSSTSNLTLQQRIEVHEQILIDIIRDIETLRPKHNE
jgi:hypothetical protein